MNMLEQINEIEIWNYIIKSTNLKKNSNYAELGCPSWGMFEQSKKYGFKNYFIKYENSYFFNCIYKLNKKIKIEKFSSSKIYDFLGIYNYIDQILDTQKFIKNIKKISKYVGIITTPYNSSHKIDCQHFMSFQKKTFR